MSLAAELQQAAEDAVAAAERDAANQPQRQDAASRLIGTKGDTAPASKPGSVIPLQLRLRTPR